MYKNTHKLKLSILALLLLPVVGFAQITLPTIDVSAVEDPTWAGSWDLNATIDVTFDGIDLSNGSVISDGFISVDVTNLGPTDSKIVQFYLMRPTLLGGGSIGEGMGGSTSVYEGLSDPSTWIMDNTLSPAVSGTLGYGAPNDPRYFGMHTDVSTNPLTIPESLPDYPQSGSFMFYFGSLAGQIIDTNAWYNNPNDPLVFVRWQSVGEDGYDGDSGKGIGGGPNFEPAIPEPSEVALMAMLGLGGLLWTRRRFVKK